MAEVPGGFQSLGDGVKNIFLAGIGAMAITGEKSKQLVDQLVAKGELTVDQGKDINSELKQRAENATDSVRDSALEARMSVMSPEEREAFAAKAAEIAKAQNAKAKEDTVEAETVEVEVEVDEAKEEPAKEEPEA